MITNYYKSFPCLIFGGRLLQELMAGLLRLLFFLMITCGNPIHRGVQASSDIPTPSPWPLQFHSLLYINSSSGALQATDLWYDWPNGRNFNIIQHQLKNVLHDLEWTNGTSFYYDLDAASCTTMSFPVGILRPDWMDNATYLGQQSIDGFTCNVWSKADFITYYEDVETNRPVHWVFFSGMSVHVMTFEVGAVLEDSEWQAPVYCFSEENRNQAAKPLNRVEAGDTLTRWLHALDGHVGVSSHVLNQ